MAEGYVKFNLILSKYQAQKIKKAIDNKLSEVTLRLGPKNLSKGEGFRTTYRIFDKMLTHAKNIPIILDNSEKKGGILPLAALIPIVMSIIGGSAAAAGGISSAVKNAKEIKTNEAEKLANEKAIEIANLKLKQEKKSGTGYNRKKKGRGCPLKGKGIKII